MATANARGGRRRWMLHEEARAAASAVENELLDDAATEGTGRRYDFDAASVSYAVATRLLPGRLWSLWGILAAGLSIVAGLAVLDTKAAAVSQWLGVTTFPSAHWSSPGSIGAWFSNLALAAAALLCLLLYGLRRHRLDDYRGKYRRWLGASATVALANLMLSTDLHHSLAEALANASGVSAFPGSAIWWLLPAALVGGWAIVRIALDMRPCRLGLFSLSVAVGLYLTAIAAHFALLPVTAADVLFQPAAQCAGHLWLLTALLAQIRFIKLEAAGAITAPGPVASTVKTKSSKGIRDKPDHQRPVATAPQSTVAMTAPESRQPAAVATAQKKSPLPAANRNSTQWTDGRIVRGRDDEDDERPLSKAERKRLRKEARNRAA